MTTKMRCAGSLLCLLALASRASALPVELRDSNGTKYNINTDVSPLITNSFASGAVTDATYNKTVTVTSYYVGITFFGFLTTYTVQREIKVPLTNAFTGFNGFLLVGSNGAKLPSAKVYNPAQAPVSTNCTQNGQDRQLVFATQSFTGQNPPGTGPGYSLELSRQVWVNNNNPWVRWLNIVKNTGQETNQIGIALEGLLGSTNETRVTATSTGDTFVNASDLWWTTRQQTPQGTNSLEPAIGFGVQGAGAQVPALSIAINTLGQASAVWAPTLEPGQTAIVMTFSTVVGNNNDAKNQISKVMGLPSSAIQCISEQQLSQVINFPHLTPPTLKKATITLKFNKTGQDTVQWKGSLNIGSGISLDGLPVTVDVGGATQSFVLNKSGQGKNGSGNNFTLSAKLKQGVTKGGQTNFNFNLKGDFQAALAAYDLANTTESDVAVTVPVTFTAGPGVYTADQAFTYKATADKKGTATAPPSS